MIYLVTRHPGTLQWLQRIFKNSGVYVRHIEGVRMFNVGDCVMGNLPVNRIAELNNIGVRYFHLSVDIPETLRGRELVSGVLDTLSARLEEFHVTRISSDDGLPSAICLAGRAP